MDLLVIQLLAAVFCLVALIVCGLLPVVLIKNSSEDSALKVHILSLLNCFACGVFLSTCFLGLVPHVRMQEMHLKNISRNSSASSGVLMYMDSWTDLSLILGFLLVLIAEQLMGICSNTNCKDSAHGHAHIAHVSSRTRLLGEDDEESDLDDLSMRPPPLVQHVHKPAAISFHSITLLLGLGVHTVFEGVALGLQTSRSTFIHLYIGVMLHEVLCAFAFGTSLAKGNTKFTHSFILVAFLALMIPFGILIALIVPANNSVGTLMTRLILEGMAAGTFIYVACVEMLPAELDGGGGHSHAPGAGGHGGKGSLLKAVAVVAGFLCFFLLSSLSREH